MSSVAWDPEVEAYLLQAYGKERLQSISACLQRPPLNTCVRVNDLKVDAEEIIRRIKEQAAQQQEGWLAAGKDPHVVPGVPFAIIVPGCGPHDIDYSCCGEREVVVGRKAAEAVLRGAPLYVPGVLACTAGIAVGDLVVVSAAVELPGSNSFGLTRGTILGSAHNQQHRTDAPQAPRLRLGVGRTLLSRVDMFRQQSGAALVMERPVYDVPSCSGVQQGDCMLQNLPSIIAAQVLAPPPGSMVLDMCASPGGKTTLLAQLMRDQGRVIALDRSHAKVLEIENLAKELGLRCITAYRLDSTRAAYQGPPVAVAAAAAAAAVNAVTAAAAAAAAAGEAGGEPTGAATRVVAGEVTGAGNGSASAAGCITQTSNDDEAPGQASSSGRGPVAAGQGAEQGVKRQREEEGAVEVVEGFMVFKERRAAEAAGGKQDKRAARKAAARQLRGHVAPVAAEAQKAEGMERVLCGFLPESFDYILLDGPCSALGLRPRLLHRHTLKELQQTAGYQRQLIDAAVRLLRPGGHLVYSTCTINPGENEGNVRYLLDAYPCMQLVPQHPHLGSPGLVGAPSPHPTPLAHPPKPTPSASPPAHPAHPPRPPSAPPAATANADLTSTCPPPLAADPCSPSAASAMTRGGTAAGPSTTNGAAATAASAATHPASPTATVVPPAATAAGSYSPSSLGEPPKAATCGGSAGATAGPSPGSAGSAGDAAGPLPGSAGSAGDAAGPNPGSMGGGGARMQERWLTESEAQLVQRFNPDGALDTIGFFIAKFQKTAGLCLNLEVANLKR